MAYETLRRAFGEAIREALEHGAGNDAANGFVLSLHEEEACRLLLGIAELRRWAVDRKVELRSLRVALNLINSALLVEAHDWAFDMGMTIKDGIFDEIDDPYVFDRLRDMVDLLQECGVDVSRLRAMYEALCRENWLPVAS